MLSNSEWKAQLDADSRRFWLQSAKRCCRKAARCESDFSVEMLLALALDAIVRSQ